MFRYVINKYPCGCSHMDLVNNPVIENNILVKGNSVARFNRHSCKDHKK